MPSSLLLDLFGIDGHQVIRLGLSEMTARNQLSNILKHAGPDFTGPGHCLCSPTSDRGLFVGSNPFCATAPDGSYTPGRSPGA